jgi:hypothetical protein
VPDKIRSSTSMAADTRAGGVMSIPLDGMSGLYFI